METQNKNNQIDYSKLLLLKSLDTVTYERIYYYIKTKQIKSIKTPRGIAVDKAKLANLLIQKPTRRIPKGDFSINLSETSKLNSLFRKLIDMNEPNYRNVCKNKITKYIDENGDTCINMKDYIKPQVRVLAKKLEVKEYEIIGAIYDLLHKKYLADKKTKANLITDNQ